MEASCLELALEGERLCKVDDYSAGVSFFEAAIQVGTEGEEVCKYTLGEKKRMGIQPLNADKWMRLTQVDHRVPTNKG